MYVNALGRNAMQLVAFKCSDSLRPGSALSYRKHTQPEGLNTHLVKAIVKLYEYFFLLLLLQAILTLHCKQYNSVLYIGTRA